MSHNRETHGDGVGLVGGRVLTDAGFSKAREGAT